jgi:hypothetical protein
MDVLLDRGVVRGPRRQDLRVKVYGERSFHDPWGDYVDQNRRIVKATFEILRLHYPGHPWSIESFAEQRPHGFVRISIPPLLGLNWGYTLPLDHDFYASPRPVIRAGGEILERFKIPRSSIDLAAYMSAKSRIPLLGNFRARHRQLIPA